MNRRIAEHKMLLSQNADYSDSKMLVPQPATNFLLLNNDEGLVDDGQALIAYSSTTPRQHHRHQPPSIDLNQVNSQSLKGSFGHVLIPDQQYSEHNDRRSLATSASINSVIGLTRSNVNTPTTSLSAGSASSNLITAAEIAVCPPPPPPPASNRPGDEMRSTSTFRRPVMTSNSFEDRERRASFQQNVNSIPPEIPQSMTLPRNMRPQNGFHLVNGGSNDFEEDLSVSSYSYAEVNSKTITLPPLPNPILARNGDMVIPPPPTHVSSSSPAESGSSSQCSSLAPGSSVVRGVINGQNGGVRKKKSVTIGGTFTRVSEVNDVGCEEEDEEDEGGFVSSAV